MMTELKPCPFCGYTNAGINYNEAQFLGQRYDGVKKIKFRVYGYCKKCKARGKPITVVVDDVHDVGWFKRFHDEYFPKAAEEWNRRANDGQTI